MINTKNFYKFLTQRIKFFSGVPDSNLKFFINLLSKKNISHHICVNEGSAVAMGIGYHLATKKIAGVYMQNSGLSNAMNPLLSIAHNKVYSIPLLLIVGWRGSPGSKDEPQHLVKGEITPKLLKLAGIKYEIINSDKDFGKINKLLTLSKRKSGPVAILIKNNYLSKTNNTITKVKKFKSTLSLTREEVIKSLCRHVRKRTYIISNTGYASRVLDKILTDSKNKFLVPFYMIGGMGHTSIVALGHAIKKKKADTICLDGDGSLIMHLGSFVTTGKLKLKNLKHLLINNFQHESVGGQPSNVEHISFLDYAKTSGYKKILYCNEKKLIDIKIKQFLNNNSLTFMEATVVTDTPKKLGRPGNFIRIKEKFMN